MDREERHIFIMFLAALTITVIYLSIFGFPGFKYTDTKTMYNINGEEDCCSNQANRNCGVDLSGCDSGKEYKCVINLIIVGEC